MANKLKYFSSICTWKIMYDKKLNHIIPANFPYILKKRLDFMHNLYYNINIINVFKQFIRTTTLLFYRVLKRKA